MRQHIQNAVLITLGWFFVLLGLIGVFLPLLPTTPFMILALFIFARSSPRFHQLLLNNRWFGKSLRQWEDSKSLSRRSKRKATLAIVITFSISIFLLRDRIELQLMLLVLAAILLTWLWRLKETRSRSEKGSTDDSQLPCPGIEKK